MGYRLFSSILQWITLMATFVLLLGLNIFPIMPHSGWVSPMSDQRWLSSIDHSLPSAFSIPSPGIHPIRRILDATYSRYYPICHIPCTTAKLSCLDLSVSLPIFNSNTDVFRFHCFLHNYTPIISSLIVNQSQTYNWVNYTGAGQLGKSLIFRPLAMTVACLFQLWKIGFLFRKQAALFIQFIHIQWISISKW